MEDCTRKALLLTISFSGKLITVVWCLERGGDLELKKLVQGVLVVLVFTLGLEVDRRP